ncbi:isochorismatase family protein [Thermostichus vulcanus]|uniref:Isochorismatase family protein n=1 Tax=Thermostichus vulcanus str. 'Rupite' TaxID=2813851 RepID=A0ABT0CBI4_THEVL|nr:isochorismatase family protein [Thermostichus vulcanus]MCJ2543152.1 isochorismatase family protein [Thermostichus vulcanus str. 'Rupite']
MPTPIVIPSRPDPVTFDLEETALIVVDMQNAYASKGGYVDILGSDLSEAPAVIEVIRRVLAAVRPLKLPIIFTQNGWDPQLQEAGGPGSPNWYKSNALKLMRQQPQLSGQLLIKGTWDYDFVEALRPQPGDIILQKTRYSAFAGTDFDMLLRQRGIRNLIFTGIATNVCVESTLREAFHREYFCLLLSDSTTQVGPPLLKETALTNVEKFFGWVCSSEDFLSALRVSLPEAVGIQG